MTSTSLFFVYFHEFFSKRFALKKRTYTHANYFKLLGTIFIKE